jgi:hypothetical protein
MNSASKPFQILMSAVFVCAATLVAIALPFAPSHWNLAWSLGIPIVVGLAPYSSKERNENVLLHLAKRIPWVLFLVLWSAGVVFVTLSIHGT